MKQISLDIQQRAAMIAPASYNDKERTVDVCWSTGAAVKRVGIWSDPYIEVLDMTPKCVRMDWLKSGCAPVLNMHGSYSLEDVIGVVNSASLEGGEGRATLRFSQREDVAPILQDIKDGIICNVSVGYRVHRAVKEETAGQKIPTVRCVDWEPMELSMVPMGADAGAGVRAAEQTVCELEDSPQEQPALKPGPAVRLLRLALEITQETL